MSDLGTNAKESDSKATQKPFPTAQGSIRRVDSLEHVLHHASNQASCADRAAAEAQYESTPLDAEQAAGPEFISSEDEFVTSDDDVLDASLPNEHRHTLFGSSSVAEHTSYFEKSLNETLDSLKLDDSLVLQAQLSGQLNKKSTELQEKKQEIARKIQSLKDLYKYHITENRIGKLENDIKSINTRVTVLTSGVSRKSVFGKSTKLGVCDRFPVEYNKAKDKILERVSDS